MLFLSITDAESMHLFSNSAYAVEVRLDLFSHIDIGRIETLIHNGKCPVMLTVRKVDQGGKFQGSEREREELIERLIDLEPHFFDLESDMRPQFLHAVLKKNPKTQFVLSYHNFQQTPRDLEEIYACMSQYPAFSYKIAAMALSTNDALRMLIFSKKHPKVSAICMGEKGGFARILGPVVGNIIDYASAGPGEQSAPGQLTVSEMVDIYHYPFLNAQTAIYGLIGDSVKNSLGHRHHNAVFHKGNHNAVYVKMAVEPEELPEFISLGKEMGIQGLSVTAPLKSRILPFLDEIDRDAMQIGAVNTLLFKKKHILGRNTDGLGALDAIEKNISVRGKKMVLLGAGGAARAIAFEALARGADVMILNRTVQTAKELSLSLGCRAGGLEEMPPDYDILVNCSPNPMPIDPEKMRSKTLVMDVVYFPRETAFLKEALLRGCQIIYGEEMFLNQAARQTQLWLCE